MDDLDSCPSGSIGVSQELDALNVDQITDELLNQMLQEFTSDSKVKLEVEDIDESLF